ncbi:MAG TPA: threonine--tRNA ligase [Actinomycetota bacterium]|nr:threonine--tRNA ligase [Actinomycetota bacterium]
MKVNVDGHPRETEPGTPLRDLAPQGALIALLDGEPVDLARELRAEEEGAEVVFPAPDDPRSLHVLRHSAAHVLAQAVLREFPDARYAIGPPVENGFYYDFDLPRPLTEDDLPRIEERVREIVAEDQPFRREEVPREQAISLFTEFDQPFKREILTGTDEEGQVKVGDVATLYHNADAFTDLCLGPHVPTTGHVKHVKLLNVSGAYWRRDESRPQLQRIYGTAWPTAEALEAYLHRLQEAERRDHRRLGRELDLFSSPPEVGAGIFVWHPKGGIVRKLLEDYAREEHLRWGYDLVTTPHIGRSILWETSGHLEKFAENMFPAIQAEEGDYYLKPMNCPFHVLIYRSRTRSYRELPLRFSELGAVYRHERSGTLHGLDRVRGMTQDDAHIFCTPDQIVDELLGVMDMTVKYYSAFGLSDPVVHLSTRPGVTIGTPEMWERAEAALREALDRSPYSYDEAPGEGAFYGPKIDFEYEDAIGRLWQLTTIQLDFGLPERFGLEYVGADNQTHRPVMIHRALYGSVERFFGVYLEHTAGALPPWLAPVQARLVPLKDDIVGDTEALAARFREAGLRTDVDTAGESMNYKIRRATLEKVPWICVVGPRELASGTLALRLRTGEQRKDVPVDEFLALAAKDVAERAVAPSLGG